MTLLSNSQHALLDDFAAEVCQAIKDAIKDGMKPSKKMQVRVGSVGQDKISGVTLIPAGWSEGRERGVFIEVAIPHKNIMMLHICENDDFPDAGELVKNNIAQEVGRKIYHKGLLHIPEVARQFVPENISRDFW